jgi:hypothetical protein
LITGDGHNQPSTAAQRNIARTKLMGNKVMASWLVFGLVLSSQAAAQNAGKPFVAADTWQATDKAPINDWKSSPVTPGATDPFASRSRAHLSLTPVSNTQALQRLPFYATAPYWLPRSRPFKAGSDTYSQPGTHGALINDVAALVRSASSN